MQRRLVLLFVALAALAAAGPAGALTKAQADAAALRVLRPLAAPGSTVLFGLPKAIRATQSVAVASGKRQGLLPGAKLRAAGRAVWVYWLDLAYGARFEHPGKIVLVDDATGVATRPRATLWYPLVDGRRPAYLRNPAAYTSKRWRVWANVGGARRIAAAGQPARVPSVLLNAIPPGSFSKDCLLMYGAYNDPFFTEDFLGMRDFAESVGIRVYWSTSTRAAPLADFPGRKDIPGTNDFERNVDYLTRLGGCTDILLYLDGHGSEGVTSVSAGDGGWVFGATLQLVLQQHPNVTFKVKIDSCYSGNFATPALLAKPNLLLLEMSSRRDEPSWSTLSPEMMVKEDGTPVQRAVANPGRGEFTHSNLVGLTAFAESAAEVKAAQAAGGSLLARMLARAFTLGRSSDGAELTGRTHPYLDATNISSGSATTLQLSSAASHTHPQPNPGYSYVCDKVTSVAGASLSVDIAGPGGYASSLAFTLPPGEKEHIFSFKIDAIGDYGFTIDGTLGAKSATLQTAYTVPALTTSSGAFTCPPP
ncbi:MAG TPA: hypothetical protein VNY33_03740 [Gaiellaceae bacterium]|nr:hypothetical protein [Gaiellaceae bacterium]